MASEFLSGIDVGNMYLYRRYADSLKSIENSYARVGVCGGVYDYSVKNSELPYKAPDNKGE